MAERDDTWCVFVQSKRDGTRTAVKQSAIEGVVERSDGGSIIVTASDTYVVEVPFEEAFRTTTRTPQTEQSS